MEIIDNWKKDKSIKIYTKLDDFPFAFGPLTSPILLFVIYYGNDGSIYIEHKAKASSALYNRHKDGVSNSPIEVPLDDVTQLKTSIHGSGQVVGFERLLDKGERAHIGFPLREINKIHLLAKFKIGTAGHYIGRFEQSKKPDSKSIIIPGIFETVDMPVFSIWASPNNVVIPDNTIVIATTNTLSNGRTITVLISLDFEKVESRSGDTQQIVFTS